ncbi:hypothetical protein [Haloferula sp. A504]|uniref:hypothetical protein n=1 Tax=Haloferula sp. A504 TaxID=3373601 RepID=UPI0031C9CC46|nr:hypothetical protein [Verrucomicrobiaceae bacterium E54]
MTRYQLLGLTCLLLAGCGGAVGVGGPGSDSLAKVTVKQASPASIRPATVAVFREQGFSVRSETSSSVTFEKVGGRQAEIAWKTVGNPNPVIIRPTVSWSPMGADQVRLMCDVEIAQESTVYGETVRQPMLAGKSSYSGLLKEIKRRVESQR